MGLASTLSAFALGALMATLVLLNNTDGGRGAAGAPRLLEGGTDIVTRPTRCNRLFMRCLDQLSTSNS